ncbi:unnamed protein product [Urochloa decumbens]|uniref:RING-type E3 ubiquitin transferase n=1 Tax=Urochloa decumbens TaxID=240449 RepID=A0ABC9C008_9POAL
MEAEQSSQPSTRGGARCVTLREGQRLRITGISLADPAAAAGQPEVRVWAEVGHEEERTIGMLSSEEPITPVPPLELGNGEFVLRHDSAASSVRLYGHYLYLDSPDPAGEVEGAPARSQFVVDIAAEETGGEEEEQVWVEYEPPTEEYLAERYDSDDGGGDDGGEVEEDQPRRRKPSEGGESSTNWDDMVPLAPPRFAAAGNTAGFMRITAAGSHEEEASEIVVLYRYTRFSRASSGGQPGCVEACRRTKRHWLRFAVPPAGNMASSLAWAGASLSPLVYPALFRSELQDLWSTLAVAGAIPPQAKRLQVAVDAGILRREDYTAERMDCVRGALEDIMGEEWPADYYHVGVELRLPEPVVRREEHGGGGGEEDGGAGARPPAKRRRMVAAEEECCVCLDPLESGLAAWPGCGHVFHGECVEKTLASSEACPLCRRKLSDALIC